MNSISSFDESKAALARFFASEGIDAYAALPFSSVRVTMPRLLERYPGFRPRTAFLYLAPYYAGECENLSIYAAAEDYHLFFRSFSDKLLAVLQSLYPDAEHHAFSDHSPIDERSAASAAGLGMIGRHGLLIHPRYASYIFIGELLSSLPPEAFPNAAEPREPNYCEGCGACLRACPTGILRGEGKDCLSAITQRKRELTREEFSLMKTCKTVWGCDICQNACPHAIKAKREKTAITPLSFFSENRTPSIRYAEIEAMPESEFSRRAYAWRGRKTLLRNLAAYEETE